VPTTDVSVGRVVVKIVVILRKGKSVMRNFKSLSVWLCLAALTLAGCLVNSSDTDKANLNSEINTQVVSEIRAAIPAPEPVSVLQHIGGLYRLETTLPLAEVVTFYRTEYSQRGAAERVAETTISSTSAVLVFDGDPSGKVVQVQITQNDAKTLITVELK